jgi:hypothetical protein
MEKICRATGAEIILHERYIEITGSKSVVCGAYQAMIATDYFKVLHAFYAYVKECA